jgi:hypothetical protein
MYTHINVSIYIFTSMMYTYMMNDTYMYVYIYMYIYMIIYIHIFTGSGSFANVRKGTNQFTGGKVALKYLKKSEILSFDAVERTANEIQCLSSLRHQNIIRLETVCS